MGTMNVIISMDNFLLKCFFSFVLLYAPDGTILDLEIQIFSGENPPQMLKLRTRISGSLRNTSGNKVQFSSCKKSW